MGRGGGKASTIEVCEHVAEGDPRTRMRFGAVRGPIASADRPSGLSPDDLFATGSGGRAYIDRVDHLLQMAEPTTDNAEVAKAELGKLATFSIYLFCKEKVVPGDGIEPPTP